MKELGAVGRVEWREMERKGVGNSEKGGGGGGAKSICEVKRDEIAEQWCYHRPVAFLKRLIYRYKEQNCTIK